MRDSGPRHVPGVDETVKGEPTLETTVRVARIATRMIALLVEVKKRSAMEMKKERGKIAATSGWYKYHLDAATMMLSALCCSVLQTKLYYYYY